MALPHSLRELHTNASYLHEICTKTREVLMMSWLSVKVLMKTTQNLSGKPVGSDEEIFREHTTLTWKFLYLNKKLLLPLGSIVNEQNHCNIQEFEVDG
jgi:hypothetical protein